VTQELLDSENETSPMRRRRPRMTRLLVAVVVLALLVVAGALVVRTLPDPFTERTTDRSSAPLLVALTDIAEYHAATGTFQVLVDLEKDTPYLPDVISGERTTMFATGHADALVDFSALNQERVTVSPDGQTVTIALPPPRLAPATLDPANTRVVGRDRGIMERLDDALADNPTNDDELYQLATRKIDEAAAQSELLVRAEENTRTMLTSLIRSLGHENVTVTFTDPR
jgi:hypothetical protein